MAVWTPWTPWGHGIWVQCLGKTAGVSENLPKRVLIGIAVPSSQYHSWHRTKNGALMNKSTWLIYLWGTLSCLVIVNPCHRQVVTVNCYLLQNRGVDHQCIKAAMMASTDGTLLKRQVRVCRDMLVQYLLYHRGEKIVHSVQTGNWSTLHGPCLPSLLAYQYRSPLYKPCGDTNGITL